MCIYYIQHVLPHNAIFCFCQIFVMLLVIVQKPNSGPKFHFKNCFVQNYGDVKKKLLALQCRVIQGLAVK